MSQLRGTSTKWKHGWRKSECFGATLSPNIEGLLGCIGSKYMNVRFSWHMYLYSRWEIRWTERLLQLLNTDLANRQIFNWSYSNLQKDTIQISKLFSFLNFAFKSVNEIGKVFTNFCFSDVAFSSIALAEACFVFRIGSIQWTRWERVLGSAIHCGSMAG